MSKTVQLIDALSFKEAKEFSLVMQSKSEQWLELFKYLLICSRKNQDYNKEKAFKIYYGTKPKSEKDNIKFRQLLSSLNAEIVSFMVKKDFEKDSIEFDKQQHKTYFKRGLQELLKEEAEKLLDGALQRKDYEGASEMLLEKINYQMNIKGIKDEKTIAETNKDWAGELETSLKKDFVRKLRNVHRIRAYNEYLIKNNSPEFSYFEIPDDIVISSKEFSDELAWYHYYQARAYQSFGDNPVEFSKKALDFLLRAGDESMENNHRAIILFNNLAVFHSLKYEFKEANYYYSNLFERIRKIKIPMKIEMIKNYFSSMVHDDESGVRQRAMDFFSTYKSRIDSESKFKSNFYLLWAANNLFLDKPKEALTAFAPAACNILELPDDQRLYAYYIKITANFQLREQGTKNDNLENEKRNLKEFWKKADKNALDLDFETITKLFLEFVDVFSFTDKERKVRISKMKTKTLKALNVRDLTQRNYLPLKLLKKELEKLSP